MPPVMNDPNQRGDYIHQLDAAHRKGLITWESVTRAQDAVMPRCQQCGDEPVIDAGTGLGARCLIAKMREAQS